jgi:hypothetical protein
MTCCLIVGVAIVHHRNVNRQPDWQRFSMVNPDRAALRRGVHQVTMENQTPEETT